MKEINLPQYAQQRIRNKRVYLLQLNFCLQLKVLFVYFCSFCRYKNLLIWSFTIPLKLAGQYEFLDVCFPHTAINLIEKKLLKTLTSKFFAVSLIKVPRRLIFANFFSLFKCLHFHHIYPISVQHEKMPTCPNVSEDFYINV